MKIARGAYSPRPVEGSGSEVDLRSAKKAGHIWEVDQNPISGKEEPRTRKGISFKAEDGMTRRGWRYLLDGRSGKVPTIVMAQGFSAVKEMYLDCFAEANSGHGVQPDGGMLECDRSLAELKGKRE